MYAISSSFIRSLLFISAIFTTLFPQELKVVNRPTVDMSQLHLDELYFPQDFKWGFAIAEQQNSGADNLPDSNWTHWEKTTFPNGTPHIKENQQSGKSCDHWNLYHEDIKLMKQDFNANAFRFSVAWDRIEPVEGTFSEEALQHYSNEVDALIAAGIDPMITLHHFSHPQWFENKGGFEKEENIALFVRFAKKVFEGLSDRVTFWCTVNEPTIYTFQGYLPFNCVFPPAKPEYIVYSLGMKVLKNLLQAHAETYVALKAMPGGDKAQIGFVHQYLKFEPYSWYNLLDRTPGALLNKFMNDSVLTFLKTGTFGIGQLFSREEYTAPQTKIADFIGLNYYSRALIQWAAGSCYPGEVMTDMPYAIYAAGLYYAIREVASIGLPIYITENGIADKEDTSDWRREKWFKEYLKTLSLAIEDGYDVRGYYCWTLMDNFEWDCGFTMKFGLYSVDRTSQKRTLKEGSRVYANVVKAARQGSLMRHTSDYKIISATSAPSATENYA